MRRTNFYFWIGQGSIKFTHQTTYATASNSQSVIAADLNGDNKSDIIVANCAANSTSVLFNTGNGTFANQTSYSAGHSLTFVAAADVNDDSKPDIIVVNCNANNVDVFSAYRWDTTSIRLSQ